MYSVDASLRWSVSEEFSQNLAAKPFASYKHELKLHRSCEAELFCHLYFCTVLLFGNLMANRHVVSHSLLRL